MRLYKIIFCHQNVQNRKYKILIDIYVGYAFKQLSYIRILLIIHPCVYYDDIIVTEPSLVLIIDCCMYNITTFHTSTDQKSWIAPSQIWNSTPFHPALPQTFHTLSIEAAELSRSLWGEGII